MNLETKEVYDFVQKTRGGEMVWRREVPSSDFTNSRTVEQYKTRFHDEALELRVESRIDSEADADYYRSVIHLWLLDEQGAYLWRFPDSDGLSDLLDTVRFQTGNVAERLKRLMQNEKGG